MKRLRLLFNPSKLVFLFSLLFLGLSCKLISKEREAVIGTYYSFQQLLQPVPVSSKLDESNDFLVWGGSMVQDEDGMCHLYYSRWPKITGHRGWITHSEVAHAVAENPLGPYTFNDVALLERGEGFWDGFVTHNPNVHMFKGKYYLYYTGSIGDRKSY